MEEKAKAICPYYENCPIFAKRIVSPVCEAMTKMFCTSEIFTKCERYTLKQSGQEVPINLLPNGKFYHK